MGNEVRKPDVKKRWELPPELRVQNLGGRKIQIFTDYTAKKLDNKRALNEVSRGNTLALAVAMQECKHIDSMPHEPDYPFGDQVLAKDGKTRVRLKTGWAANFGLFKMNWFMIWQCPTGRAMVPDASALLEDKPSGKDIWKFVGQRINQSPQLSTRILLEAWNKWDTDVPDRHPDNFWAGHRWGWSGLVDAKPPADCHLASAQFWDDILDYYWAVQATRRCCDANLEEAWASDARYGGWVAPI